jgi:hypothetical protein
MGFHKLTTILHSTLHPWVHAPAHVSNAFFYVASLILKRDYGKAAEEGDTQASPSGGGGKRTWGTSPAPFP